MPLGAGARLGPYEIQSAIGAGGMGEVYKARDTRLDRTVAVKVLPAHIAADLALKQRFEREAKTLAALSHPHICSVFDVGNHEGIDFLVMEYLEGDTLATRLAQDGGPEGPPLRVEEALAIATQIANALDKAHRAGIVHRDLKPANIMLTKSGAKLLDFGLAKVTPAAVAASGLSMAPTGVTPMTMQGTILGTLQYMAPEQIEGEEADARTDIFAFGAVVYEILTGKKAFEGKTQASLIGAILKDAPRSISSLQPLTPPGLDRIVQTCLAKDPDERWQTARDLLRELQWVIGAPLVDANATKTAGTSVAAGGFGLRGRALPWVVSSVLGVAAALVLVLWAPWSKAPPSPPVRLEAGLGAEVSLSTNSASADATLSPDGRTLAFAGRQGETSKLYVRRLDQLQASARSGTEDAANPFFSPDGQWVAFFAGGKLKKIAVTGGAAVTLCDAPSGRGGWWDEGGSITYSPSNGAGFSLMRVSSAGGTPQQLTKLADGELTQRWPQVLPGGRAVLYMGTSNVGGTYDDANIVVQPLPAGPRKIVVRGGHYPRYLPTGHLTYIHEGTLFAAPFDPDRLELSGQPVPVLEGVASPGGGAAQVAISPSGTLVYLPGPAVGDNVPVSWMDRDGKTTALRATSANWSNPHFSPDGRQLALDIFDGSQSDVWVYDWSRDTLSRVTFDSRLDSKPVWTPDGTRIVFTSNRGDGGRGNLYWQRADGTGDVQRLTESQNIQSPASWHPSGKFLAFSETDPQTTSDLMILPMEGNETAGWKPGKPTVFLNSRANEFEPMFSPDGRWLAYQSNETGRGEVYVRPFPGPGGKWQVSSDGGFYPTWSRTRPELFFSGSDEHLMVASYTADGTSFKADKPRPWSEGRYGFRPRNRSFDLHPDGNRFALAPAPATEEAAAADRVVFIFNFFDELRRLAPPSRP